MEASQSAHDITILHSRVENLHQNSSAFPIFEMHFECLPDSLGLLYVSFIADPMLQAGLCELIRQKNQKLLKLGIEACSGPRAAVKLDVPTRPERREGVLVCPMIWLNPGQYPTNTDVAHLFKKVGTQLGTPNIRFPEAAKQTPIDSILTRVLRSRVMRVH